MAAVHEQGDGRRLRREANRQAVIDALVSLYADGHYLPSAAEVAERSGLSPRSVFRYFDDTDDLTRAAFRRRLTAYARDRDLGQAYPFFVFRASDDALTGGITLSNVRRGVAQMGSIGYWCGRPFTRQGHTLAAVRAVCDFGFRTLGLHRLEAACIPENDPSRRLLAKAGDGAR